MFTPFELAGMTLRNRFVMPAMQRELAPDGVPSPEMAEHYRRRVEGGVSLVIGEATAIDHPTATQYTKYARFTGPALDGWRRVLEAVKGEGGRLFLQLWHQGAVRAQGVGPFPEVASVSPSGLRQSGEPNGRQMTRRDMAEIRQAFVDAAGLARELGFDGVELHAAHGYLLDQFLWSETNQRRDEYGGDHIARTRYPSEVVSAVRAQVGEGFPISVRISQWKERKFEARIAQTPDELRDILGAFRTAGVDLFHASTRRFWESEFDGSDRGFAGWVRALGGLPVITVGSVGLDNDIMSSLYGERAASSGATGVAELVRRFNLGEFDLVAVGRAILSDPDWVTKVRDHRYRELRPFTKEDLSFLTV
ncbi:MAG TPA: 12-oxophytodienoate reductase [Caulobacteraceae bacterium]|nr:12-oxophytodienoate reductase [Caulobacteraceae bacterium]